LPKRTVVATLECAGNGRLHFEPQPEGTAWEDGAISTAIWTGVALRDVLAMATPMAECKEVKFTGMDRGERDGVEIPFARSLPLGKALDPDTLLVYEMNGEPLTSDHGFPLRLVVPNWYAVAAVKWLSRIELLGTDFTGHFQTAKYVMRYSPADPGKPVKNMVVKSLIVDPVTGARVPQNFPCRIAGKAWSGNGSIRCVEVSTDGGATWHQADIGEDDSPYAWKSWLYTWIPTHAGVHRLCVRATDALDNVQPTVPEWNVDGYQYNGIHSVQVVVE
jgi:sulfite oxidase